MRILNRRSIRLKGYDYSQEGLYFISICCQNRACLFGKIIQDEMILNDAGNMISTEWLALKNRFANIRLHEYIVMPNHFHGILEIVENTAVIPTNNIVGTSLAGVPDTGKDYEGVPNNEKGNHEGVPQRQPQGCAPTVGDIIGAFKSITSVEYIRGIKTNNWKQFNKRLWQRNYWEHIIRNDESFNRISAYITDKPGKWKADKLK